MLQSLDKIETTTGLHLEVSGMVAEVYVSEKSVM